MSKLNKIDIYVGTVGSTYIDKTTAQANYNDTLKNVSDTEAIIEKATALKNIVEGKVAETTNVYEAAVALGQQLDAAISSNSSNVLKYKKLKEIQIALTTNDIDGDYTNGGNVLTAQLNLTNAQNQLQKITNIITDAQVLLEDYQKSLVIYQSELNELNAIFNEYTSSNGGSSSSEDNNSGSLDERIEDVESNLEIIDNTNTAVENTTAETIENINDVINESEGEPIVVSNTYWYLGQTPILSNQQNFTVTDSNITEDDLDSWHVLDLKTIDNAQYLIKSVNSLSTNKTWYMIIPSNPELTPIKSNLQDSDDRFSYIKEVYVNGSIYKLYTISNNVVDVINGDTSKLNIILRLEGSIVNPQPEDPTPVDPTPQLSEYGYIYIGTELPTAPYNPEANLVTEELGWRKITAAHNTYNNSNPLYDDDTLISDSIIAKYYYVILPQGFVCKDRGTGLSDVFDSVYGTLSIGNITYNIYAGRDTAFNAIIYYESAVQPEPQPKSLYWYVGKGPVNVNTTPGEGDGWTLIEDTPESIFIGDRTFVPELIGGEHYTQEEIDAAQEGDDAYGKTIEDWKVEPTEIKKINWVIAVPSSLNLNNISNGATLVTDSYESSIITCADGIEYKVFIQVDTSKSIVNITIQQ